MPELVLIKNDNLINPGALRYSRKLSSELINGDVKVEASDILEDHTAEPIKKIEDINRICTYLLNKGRYRDYMLFVVGINFGLRVSDLRMLKFGDIIDKNLVFKNSIPVFEIKTRNTRKKKKNRYITINDAVVEAVTIYLEHTPNVSLDDYMFKSVSPRNKNSNTNTPLTRMAFDLVLKRINDELGLGLQMSTHTLRKTFCYHQMLMSNNDPRKLLLLSKMLGHSSVSITLDYIGITRDEMEEAYKKLNLGLTTKIINSSIEERETDNYEAI